MDIMGCAMEYNLEQLQKVICCDFFEFIFFSQFTC